MDEPPGEAASAVLGADVDAAQLRGRAGGVALGEVARVRRVGRTARVERGRADDATPGVERDEEGVAG